MARFDPYIDETEYEARANGGDPIEDAETLALDIAAMQAVLDSELGLIDGAFNEVSAETHILDGTGKETLRLRDPNGRAFLLRSTGASGIGVDTERDGTYDGDTPFSLSAAWVQGIEYRRTSTGVAYKALRLIPVHTAPFTRWPRGRGIIRIVGDCGYPGGPPEAIKGLLTALVRDFREHLSSGDDSNHVIAGEVVVTDQTWRTMLAVKKAFSRKMQAVA